MVRLQLPALYNLSKLIIILYKSRKVHNNTDKHLAHLHRGDEVVQVVVDSPALETVNLKSNILFLD